MMKKKPYAAFLSFAGPDRELVEHLSNLLSSVGAPAYFAPQQLPKAGSPEWRREIIKGIRESACFVPIYTRHSLTRPWVLYESGLADASKLPRYPARASSVDTSEIEYLPGPGVFVHDLSDSDSLAELIAKICVCHGADAAESRIGAYDIVQRSPLAARIVELSRERWVFVAGNYPEGATSPGSGIEWFTTREEYLGRLKDFVQRLTSALLAQGFCITACPQVDAVGMHVISRAVAWIDSTSHPAHVDFSIGGIHPIDRTARVSALSETARRRWLDHIMAFRRTYLASQEWIILLGGNEGTMEECGAAKGTKVKVLAIPCFGGAAAKVFHDNPPTALGPCKCCRGRNGLCNDEQVRQIVQTLKKPAVVNP